MHAGQPSITPSAGGVWTVFGASPSRHVALSGKLMDSLDHEAAEKETAIRQTCPV